MPGRSKINIVVEKNGMSIPLSGDFADAIFSTDLRPMSMPPGIEEDDLADRLDPANHYNHNNYNFRGPDFSSENVILAAGCSATYGVGVPENGTWPHLLAKDLGVSYSNLSRPGASVEWIVDSIFRYINTFGAPKYIFVLFPDLFRGEVVLNKNINRSAEVSFGDFFNQDLDEERDRNLMTHTSQIVDVGSMATLLKKPFPIEETTPPEEPLYRSIKAIQRLEQYVSSLKDTKLAWSSWSEDLIDIAENLPEEYRFRYFCQNDGYKDWYSNWHSQEVRAGDPKDWLDYKLNHDELAQELGCTDEMLSAHKCICKSTCHLDQYETYTDAFHAGTDRFIKEDNFHVGVHVYIHVAEDFAKSVREI